MFGLLRLTLNFNCNRLNMNHVMTPVKTEFYFTVIFCLVWIICMLTLTCSGICLYNRILSIRNIKLFNHLTQRIDKNEYSFGYFLSKKGRVGRELFEFEEL